MLRHINVQIREILSTYRRRKALAEMHTPGGKLNQDDLRGVLRTVANIHRVDLPTVIAAIMMEGDL